MPDRDLDEPLITPLVRALTRAPTLMGVPYLYFMFNGVASSVCFLLSHNLLMLLVGIDPPPLKWSALRYGFRALEDGRNGKAA